MKKILLILAIVSIVAIDACKEKHITEPATTTLNTDNYSSMADFFSKNAMPMQTYTMDAATGITFTTPQGTVVTIAANSFVDNNWNPITSGNVSIEFKDIYKKSDMLLNNMPTSYLNGQPMKSGGEFFIRVKQGNTLLKLSGASPIIVKQPLNGLALDTAMKAMNPVQDTVGTGGKISWYPTPVDTFGHPVDSLTYSLQNYVFKLYQLCSPLDSGTWTNCDHCFANYTQTSLTLHGTDDVNTYSTNVFITFKDVNTNVSIYGYTNNNFDYSYAPLTYRGTVVAWGIKDHKLYSSFTPITIGANQTVNFTLTETTTDKFKAAVTALD